MYSWVQQEQMLKGLADLSGTIMQAQITEEILLETATEAISPKVMVWRVRKALNGFDVL